VGPSLEIIGGQSVAAVQLADRLGEEPDVEVSFLAINPRLPRAVRALQSVKYLRTLVNTLVYVAGLVARVPRHDVVHVFSASHLSFVLSPTPAILAAKLLRKAVILHYHSGEAGIHLRRWQRTAIPTMRLADAIVVSSRYLVEEFARYGLRTRRIVNVIDTGRFRFRARPRLDPVFLSSRQLLPHYNVACVLRAVALVQQQLPDARLIVAGDGHERPRLEALARELGLSGAEFRGWVAPARMPELYGDADVYLNGADLDNSPLSVVEAFAAGLPVVATAVGGVPELVRDGETGVLVPPGDHAAMAHGALRLLGDPEFAARVVSGARDDCSRFRWSAVRGHWLELYGELSSKP
jgi:glycosyltransferase involved in cell wall biosynthesis